MRHLSTRRLGAILALSVATLPLAAHADDDADRTAIRDLWGTYAEARVAGDADTWLALWDDGGMQMPPGTPALGVDVLRARVPEAFAAGGVNTMRIDPQEIEISGDWAYARGVYDSDRLMDGAEVTISGKFLTILRRQDDGSWRIYRDIFNGND